MHFQASPLRAEHHEGKSHLRRLHGETQMRIRCRCRTVGVGGGALQAERIKRTNA